MSEIPELLRGIAPNVGELWLWEPEKPHARELVTVVEVKWNGEEVWIGTRGETGTEIAWNDLSRWVEATVYISRPTSEETP